MAHILPTYGYVSSYGALTLHDGSTKCASTYVKTTMAAIDQSVELPDGRVIDLASSENTIWVPTKFKQRYFISSGAAVWQRTIQQTIDNATAATVTFTDGDGLDTHTATGRMLSCIDVTPIGIHGTAKMEIECSFIIYGDWA